jgi:hypothetical protein
MLRIFLEGSPIQLFMIDPRLGSRLVEMGPGQYQVGWSQLEVYQRPDGRMAVRDITGWDGTDQITPIGPAPSPAPAPAGGVGGWLHKTFDPMLKSKGARIAAGVLSGVVGLFGVALAVGGGGHHGGGIGVLGGALLAGAGATGVYVSATYKEPTAKAA